ncbi:MAG: glycosyltransferase family 2 protein [Candidatus Hodarchaeota archaeon]
MEIQLGAIFWIFSGFFYLICTLYYGLELIPAYFRHRNRFLNPEIPNDEKIQSILRAKKQRFPAIKFQITTRGNEVDVVKRGIQSIAALARNSKFISRNIELLIVTDNPDELKLFSEYIRTLKISFQTEVIVVPQEYQTRNNTLLKARSLQYSLEFRNSKKSSLQDLRSFIFYLDAESTINEKNFRRIVYSIIVSTNKKIFEGPIIYPHKYFKANILSRRMEATRPFHCHHCVQVMMNPPPIHLHGSNLLVEESLVNEITWDFGRYKEQPILAEDLLFGLKAYSKYGKDIFSWHGGQISEQPPFSVRESINARLRWVSGAWQAISLIKKDSFFSQQPWKVREMILFRLRLRIVTHSLSFFASLFLWIAILFFLFPSLFSSLIIVPSQLPRNFRVLQGLISLLFFFPGTIFWIFGILNGLSKNIKPLNLTWKRQILEYGKIMVVTPIAASIEAFCALSATVRWIIGKPYNSWYVTSK